MLMDGYGIIVCSITLGPDYWVALTYSVLPLVLVHAVSG